ncbi:pseudouridine synthase [Patescibacteria group bacterium]|nr:pseudouridine synthase [Patescibacteria group bacterium]
MNDKINYPIRINRYLALNGVATRRDADKLIQDGLVFINKKKAVLGDKVQETDKIEILKDDKHIKKLVYIVYYKPRGIVTHSPRTGEKSIKDTTDLPGIFPIGRLDKESEGLMLLTNDGRVTERVLHPRFAHEKEYDVIVREKVPSRAKRILEAGIRSSGELLTAKKVRILSEHRMLIVLTEGKTHQIRRMLDTLRLTVENLKRTRVMNIELRTLKPGDTRIIEGPAQKAFLNSIGLK